MGQSREWPKWAISGAVFVSKAVPKSTAHLPSVFGTKEGITVSNSLLTAIVEAVAAIALAILVGGDDE